MSTGFSLLGLGLAGTKTHRLRPVLLKPPHNFLFNRTFPANGKRLKLRILLAFHV